MFKNRSWSIQHLFGESYLILRHIVGGLTGVVSVA